MEPFTQGPVSEPAWRWLNLLESKLARGGLVAVVVVAGLGIKLSMAAPASADGPLDRAREGVSKTADKVEERVKVEKEDARPAEARETPSRDRAEEKLEVRVVEEKVSGTVERVREGAEPALEMVEPVARMAEQLESVTQPVERVTVPVIEATQARDAVEQITRPAAPVVEPVVASVTEVIAPVTQNVPPVSEVLPPVVETMAPVISNVLPAVESILGEAVIGLSSPAASGNATAPDATATAQFGPVATASEDIRPTVSKPSSSLVGLSSVRTTGLDARLPIVSPNAHSELESAQPAGVTATSGGAASTDLAAELSSVRHSRAASESPLPRFERPDLPFATLTLWGLVIALAWLVLAGSSRVTPHSWQGAFFTPPR
jgi:hypothetical protein